MTLRDIGDAVSRLDYDGRSFRVIDLAPVLQRRGERGARLPLTQRILLENLLRQGGASSPGEALATVTRPAQGAEIAFRPARIVMQDYAGLPALLDLAGLRDAQARHGIDPATIEPACPVDLVIDHSHVANVAGTSDALSRNLTLEYARNRERYGFLRWAGGAFRNLRIVPPGKGILHQIHLEAIAEVVSFRDGWLMPDTVIGTDSHTTMINGLGVLGWGVGGLEATVAMLGLPLPMAVPGVTGVRLRGGLRPGLLASDAVLEITARLRRHGVTGRLVEFCGLGLDSLRIPDRATIANMAPEYGATCGLFPIDRQSCAYLTLTGRDPGAIGRVEAYARHLGLWRAPLGAAPEPWYEDLIEFDLDTVDRCVAGPRRPQEVAPLAGAAAGFRAFAAAAVPPPTRGDRLDHGDIVIAAITSCTNTANPAAMVAAGLLARRARTLGLRPPIHVRCSLAPGSHAVAAYLAEAGLLEDLAALGFHIVGFGCSSCVGNSGELDPMIAEAIRKEGLTVAAMLSGNRNFEGRIHPLVRVNYLASPPLVVAYALAGTMLRDLTREPLGEDRGSPVFLSDLWPAPETVDNILTTIGPHHFATARADLENGGPAWDALAKPATALFPWSPESSYVAPPLLDAPPPVPDAALLAGAVPLLMLGDGITTDHISPVGRIDPAGDAGHYLMERGIAPRDFNSYGARRGNPAVMVRGGFANPRLRNLALPGSEGPVALHLPTGETTSIHEAARRYRAAGIATVVVAGKDYGIGSARDWAAKATRQLGIRAVLAESFERIHRANLALIGVLPLQLGEAASDLGIGPQSRLGLDANMAMLRPGARLALTIDNQGMRRSVEVVCRLDTRLELDCFRRGGIFAAMAA